MEDNAGALVAPDTLARAQAAGVTLQAHLDLNDAYSFFDAIGDLVVTGPTNQCASCHSVTTFQVRPGETCPGHRLAEY